jgi:hypothetical protein
MPLLSFGVNSSRFYMPSHKIPILFLFRRSFLEKCKSFAIFIDYGEVLEVLQPGLDQNVKHKIPKRTLATLYY